MRQGSGIAVISTSPMSAKQFLRLTTCIAFLGAAASAQDAKTNAPIKIPASEAARHIGKERIVFGEVVEVSQTDKLIRLNLDRPFPNQPFTAVIFAHRTNSFTELGTLKGKRVEIQGKITTFRDRPQMVLSRTNQLTVSSPN